MFLGLFNGLWCKPVVTSKAAITVPPLLASMWSSAMHPVCVQNASCSVLFSLVKQTYLLKIGEYIHQALHFAVLFFRTVGSSSCDGAGRKALDFIQLQAWKQISTEKGIDNILD